MCAHIVVIVVIVRSYIRTKFVDSLRTITLDRDPRATEPIDLQREYHIFVKVLSQFLSSLAFLFSLFSLACVPHSRLCLAGWG
jgi:hypothetical protein